jgi:DNA-binding transcriptional ArsR family regulator
MAATYRKPSGDKLGKHSKARPRSESKPRLATKQGSREDQARRASILLKSVSDPTRLEMILVLANGEQHVRTLHVRLGESQPAVSYHLALLRASGIITPRREGAKNVYGLTDAGCALAEVVQGLLDEGTTEQPSVRPGPTRGRSASTDSPRLDRQASTDSRDTLDPRSDVRNGDEEEEWSRMNRRRAELIFKKNRGHLNDVDSSELERLQALSLSRMQREFPAPTLIDGKLERIEARLRDVRAKKV